MTSNSEKANNSISVPVDLTKKICLFLFLTIILIIILFFSPINQFIQTSFFIKIIVLLTLGYIIFLSLQQTINLKTFFSNNSNPTINSSLNKNILFSYIFTLFLGILFIIILRNMIYRKI